MAQAVQDRLEESLGEDAADDVEASAANSPPPKDEDTIADLRRALSESEMRNEGINREFQKLLRQKEEELVQLRQNVRAGPSLSPSEFPSEVQDANNPVQDSQHIQVLLAQKDEVIGDLEKQLHESEAHVRRLEQQGRDNEEKVMHELAVKIRAAEGFQLKLEETKQLLEDRNKTVEGLMDRLDAQKRLIESRDQVIDQLKAMKNLDSGADELVGVLREQIEAMNARVEKSVDEAGRAKREISALKKELEEKSELIASAEKLEQEKSSLLMQIQEIEKEHKQTVLRLQHDVEEKEKALAAEFAEAEQVYKTNEHDLRERLDEKAQIIESKDEAIQVLKKAIQEKNLSSEGSSPPSHSDKVMALLEEKVKEREEMIRSLSEKMNFLEKGSVDKTSEIDFLKKSIDDKASTIKVLQETLQAKDQEIAGIKEKHETEMSEKEMKLSSQIKSNEELQKMVASLKDSLSELESKEKVTERLLLLDAEKEQQFRDEKQAFHDSEKALHGQLQVSLDHNSKMSDELTAARSEIEAKEKEVKDLNSKIGKLKLQAKAKVTGLQNEKEKLSKDMQEVLYGCFSY